jgi:hypothetical protein
MIWFACSKCGKTHGRPQETSGVMIFCDCGNGLTVPWSSTAPEPADAPQAEAPVVPELVPMTFDVPAGPKLPPPRNPPKPPPLEDDEPVRRRGRAEKRDPDYCFNHQRLPMTRVCSDCKEAFCGKCLVEFQGATLCGPCKNFRTRKLELPSPNSKLASASLIIALIAGPLSICLITFSQSSGIRILSLMALLPQLAALGLGIWAIRMAEKSRKLGGQSLAVTGVATAALTTVFALLLQVYASRV